MTDSKTMSVGLAKLVAAFQRYFYMPDPGALLVTLATAAANLLEGDPVWLLVIAPPAWLKTDVIQTVARVRHVYSVGDLSVAGLLTGSPHKDWGLGAKGGLLPTIGSFGILLWKDFTSVLTMHREKREALLGALREIYDGRYVRVLGNDGGNTLPWEGKLGIIGACTEAIDTCHAVMSTMGERFVLYRLPRISEEEQARRALNHSSSGSHIREELAELVSQFFAELEAQATTAGTPAELRERLVPLSTLIAHCRSSVVRDNSREIELVPGSEGPGRIAIVMERLAAGLLHIGVDEGECWRLIKKVAFDCIPVRRRALLELLVGAGPGGSSVDDLCHHYSPTTTRRDLKDLEAHEVILRTQAAGGRAETWQVSQWTRERLNAIGGLPGVATYPGESVVSETSGVSAGDSVPAVSGSPPQTFVSGTSGSPPSVSETSDASLIHFKDKDDIPETNSTHSPQSATDIPQTLPTTRQWWTAWGDGWEGDTSDERGEPN
jgi:hypothetical protein